MGVYRSTGHHIEIIFISLVNADFYQSERQSDGSRDESEEPASYDDNLLEYEDGEDGERYSLSLREFGR